MPRSTVLVTGGAGFIGSTLTDALLRDGHQVVVVDDLSTGREANVSPEASLEKIDISELERLRTVVRASKPSAIFHIGAQSSVTVSVTDPGRDCQVNVAGTLNVVECASEVGASVVFTSTGGALYGNEAPIPTPEDFLPAPLAPYGASKWAGEAYVLTWARSSGLPHAVCRLGNVYGPRQSPHGEAGVVAIFSHHLWSGQRPTVFGFGKPTRDYVHVTDVVGALMAASGRFGVYNIATGTETDVKAVLERLAQVAGVDVAPVLAPLRPGELERSCMDPSRAAAELGWRATIGLHEGLESTYNALVHEFKGAR